MKAKIDFLIINHLVECIVKFKKMNEQAIIIYEALNKQIEQLQSLNKELAEALQELRKQAYDLKSHCIEQNYIDWEDESIDGCKQLDAAFDKAKSALDKFNQNS